MTDIYLGTGYFLLAQLCPVLARTWCPAKRGCFFGPKTQFSAQKSVFCNMTPNFVNGPFLAHGDTVHFARWNQYCKRALDVDHYLELPPPHRTAPQSSGLRRPSRMTARYRCLCCWVNTCACVDIASISLCGAVVSGW